jgi:crossover junction endodeoxyribonuclease RuvC
MVIIGIDPGSVICGYGVIDFTNNKLSLIEYGALKVKMKQADFNSRLLDIFNDIQTIVARNNPDQAVFETTFFSKNVQSLVKLTHARAAALLAASVAGVEIYEYSPREIKKSVTGKGNATKEQVRFMVNTMLSIKDENKSFDASDALAIAICHSGRITSAPTSKIKSWGEYLKLNPDKMVK